MMRWLLVLVLVGGPSIAAASPGASAFMSGPPKGTSYVLAGVNGGLVIGAGDNGWLAGAEVSMARWLDPAWFGGYIDLVVDARHDHWRTSVGGEAGWGVLGIDAGLVFDLGASRTSFRFRPCLSVSVVTLYFGPTIPIGGTGSRDVWGELGLLAKFPLRL